MDIYTIIKESKENTNLLDIDDLNKLFSPYTEKILFRIINLNENEEYSKLCEKVLKRRNDYQEAKLNDDLEPFKKEIEDYFIDVFKTHKRKKITKFFDYINNTAEEYKDVLNKIANDPDIILYKLFLNEYNNKQAFTWKQFKETKKIYEKNNTLEGEHIYNLKSFLEKDPNIEKIDNNTLFSKHNHTLSEKTIEKLVEKINK